MKFHSVRFHGHGHRAVKKLLTHSLIVGQVTSFPVVGRKQVVYKSMLESVNRVANFTAISSIERDLLSIKVLHCGNRKFHAFLLL